MREDLVDKDRMLRMASRVSGTAPRVGWRALDPRVLLGAVAVRGAVAAEHRTDTTRTPGDRKSYLPRDMVLSYLQAHSEEHDSEEHDSEEHDSEEHDSAEHDARTVTGPAFAEGFSTTRGFDYNWITKVLVELVEHIVARIWFRLPRPAPAPAPVAPDARIVVVGDWGTGEGVALRVAGAMRREIDGAAGREVHVVHLGDVYYAGTRWEAHHRFLDHWPVRPQEADRVRSWCLNGNHDMYAAGEGLFGVILPDARFAGQRTVDGRPTSEFCLRNDHWDVLGIDTSWRFRLGDVRGGHGHLGRRQRRRLAAAPDGDGARRRTMLMSHHQPFTRQRAGEDGVVEVGNLLRATAALRDGAGVDAWFWGHEHRLVSYGPRSGIRYATCMGHGAVLSEPAGADDSGPGEAQFLATFRDDDGDTWRMPGFAVIDLDGPRATVRYLDMYGTPWREPDTL